MHDFERNLNDRNLKQLFVYWQRQYSGCEPYYFIAMQKGTSKIDYYIFECRNCAFDIAISLLNYRYVRLFFVDFLAKGC